VQVVGTPMTWNSYIVHQLLLLAAVNVTRMQRAACEAKVT
jgi:hypothetical protein